MKALKKWNGRGHGIHIKGYLYVAAYSKKQAKEIIEKACDTCLSNREMLDYYSDCWGDPMNGIDPIEPCLYVSERYSGNPVKIYPK